MFFLVKVLTLVKVILFSLQSILKWDFVTDSFENFVEQHLLGAIGQVTYALFPTISQVPQLIFFP